MTTSEQPISHTPPEPATDLCNSGSLSRRRSHALSAVGALGVILGIQSLAASTPLRSDVRMLLPSEGLLAGVGDGLRRGYELAMEESRLCGMEPPTLQVGWLPPGADPGVAIGAAPRTNLLLAPPAAPLEPYGQLADQHQLNVLLTLQRGQSLDGLPQLRGSDRLWPLMPSRSLEADRLAKALLAQQVKRVMVVRDRSTESKALSDRFEASFGNGNGQVIGPTATPLSVAGDDNTALAELATDVDWYRPPALVVITQPDSELAKALRRLQWPENLLLAWTAPVVKPLAVQQIGVSPLSRGPGWSFFATRFKQRWGYKPGLVESAGFDSGLMTALAAVRTGERQGWNLQWFSANAKAQPLCLALKLRAQGVKVRPEAASSAFDQGPGLPPSARLQLSRG